MAFLGPLANRPSEVAMVVGPPARPATRWVYRLWSDTTFWLAHPRYGPYEPNLRGQTHKGNGLVVVNIESESEKYTL